MDGVVSDCECILAALTSERTTEVLELLMD